MASKKDKTTETKKETQLTIRVTRANDFTKDGKTSIAFDMEVNGVTIYGCWYREGEKDGKEWSMVNFPSIQDEKTGKYYSHAYVKLTQDQVDEIAKQLENLL